MARAASTTARGSSVASTSTRFRPGLLGADRGALAANDGAGWVPRWDFEQVRCPVLAGFVVVELPVGSKY